MKVAITGAAGQIGYSLLFRIASGEVFGPKTKVSLSLLEIPQGLKAAEGTAMELEDCAFPTLENIEIYDNPHAAFDGCDWALLVGSKPRGPGMERNDLISENGTIFVEQGKALQKANSNVMVCVVGNPCNTNALIAMHNAKDVPAERFTAMTMLDQNRAVGQISKKMNVPVADIENLVVWGNHSSTMYPDYENARIKGERIGSASQEKDWFQSEFLTTVQQRGAAIIEARGKSSAASAANACIDHVKRFHFASEEIFSAAVPSGKNPYGIAPGLIYSFPVRSQGQGKYEIVGDFELTDFAREKLKATEKELLGERDVIKNLLA